MLKLLYGICERVTSDYTMFYVFIYKNVKLLNNIRKHDWFLLNYNI